MNFLHNKKNRLLMGLLGIPLMISGCVPSVETIYKAPVVSGQLLDVNTLKPVTGATVTHRISGSAQVTSGPRGYFKLPSLSNKEFMMLMPGHALQTSVVSVTSGDSASAAFVVEQTLNSRSEETFQLNYGFVDMQPQTDASDLLHESISIAQLRSQNMPEGSFSICDQQLANDAIVSLNAARKLSGVLREQKQHANRTDMLIQAYSQVNSLWRVFYQSCQGEVQAKMAIRDQVDLIQEELNEAANET